MHEEPQYQCPECEVSGQAVGLFTHIEVCHSVKRRFCQCPFCGEDYIAYDWAYDSTVNGRSIRDAATSHIRSCNAYAASLLAGLMVRNDPRR